MTAKLKTLWASSRPIEYVRREDVDKILAKALADIGVTMDLVKRAAEFLATTAPKLQRRLNEDEIKTLREQRSEKREAWRGRSALKRDRDLAAGLISRRPRAPGHNHRGVCGRGCFDGTSKNCAGAIKKPRGEK